MLPRVFQRARHQHRITHARGLLRGNTSKGVWERNQIKLEGKLDYDAVLTLVKERWKEGRP